MPKKKSSLTKTKLTKEALNPKAALQQSVAALQARHKQREDVALVVAEVDRCSKNFWYFCNRYVYISDRDGNTSLFYPNKEQVNLIQELETTRRVANVKARKLGMSTVLSIYGLWLAFFHQQKVGTIAHDEGSVTNIFAKVRFAYTRLPPWMKVGIYKAAYNSEKRLEFAHGGSYRISTDRQEKFRGGDLYFLHMSELSKYQDPIKTFNAALDAMLPHGVACIETTARGMGFLHGMWFDSASPWSKVFYNWFAEPSYVIDEDDRSLQRVLKNMGRDDFNKMKEYADKFALSDRQRHFATLKLAEKAWSWKDFHQEWPATPDLAFSFSEGRVFQSAFDVGKPVPGIEVFEDYNPLETYVMGVDSSSGSETGDYQSVCILRGDMDSPKIALTAYVRVPLPEFAEMVGQLARKYNALIMAERNSYGLDVINRVMEDGYPNVWRSVIYDKIGSKVSEKAGFHTSASTRPLLISKMQQYLGGNPTRMPVPCKRLQREINDFVYNPSTHKEEAAPGCHDDMLFAFALAAMALEPEHVAQHQGPQSKRPRTETEIFRWELKNGRRYDPGELFDDDTNADTQRANLFREVQNNLGDEEIVFVSDVWKGW